jgi:aldose 1-epimerase
LLSKRRIKNRGVAKYPIFNEKDPFRLELQELQNEYLELVTLDYGAIIQKLIFRDKHGKTQNCVLGFDDPQAYLQDRRSLGACIGRFAGRISGSTLKVGKTYYPIHAENGMHLHGGKQGFGRRTFTLKEKRGGDEPSITYQYFSPHLEEGYPGNLHVEVTYQLLGSTLRILHEARTDQDTVVNLTNHSYFRLDGARDLGNIQLQIMGQKRLETTASLLPTGRLLPVEGTEYDFRSPRPMGATLLDTPFAVEPRKDPKAIAWSTASGIRLSVSSNQPAVVVFTPEDLPAICFETQNYPDAPNYDAFPSCVLKPGETYRNESFFRFDLVT